MGEENIEHRVVIRKFDPFRDYEELGKWWELHKSKAPKLKFLPQNGIVVIIDDIRICAGFMYHTDSKLCVFEFVICNPETTKEQRTQALNLLIRSAQKWAQANEYEYIYTCANMNKYKARLMENGFYEGDGGQQHFLYEVR